MLINNDISFSSRLIKKEFLVKCLQPIPLGPLFCDAKKKCPPQGRHFLRVLGGELFHKQPMSFGACGGLNFNEIYPGLQIADIDCVNSLR